MRNNLTRSLSGQSNPTPRSTRNSIDGDGGGQLHVKIVKGRGLAGEPCVTTYYGETEVAQTHEWNVTVVATTAGPPSHKPHKRITLELREEVSHSIRDAFEGRGAALGTVVVDVGSLGGLDEKLRIARQWYEVRPPRRTPRHGSNYGEIELEVDYQPPKKLQSFGKGLFLDADARSLNLLGALFDRCDTNSNGELDRDEFRRLYAKLRDLDAVYASEKTMTPTQAAQLFFRDADLDGDEHVTFDEVRAAAKRAALRKLPSRVDVVVHSCRGLAHFSSVKKSTWCCTTDTLEEHTFCTVSVDGEPFSRSRLRSYTHSPRFEHLTSIEDGSHHGEVVSVELWHRRKGKAPTPLGRCDVDVLAEQLRAEPISGAQYQSSSEWHRVAPTDGFGDVQGQIMIEIRFYPPKDTPRVRGGHHASLMSPTTLKRHEEQGKRQYDRFWPSYRGPAAVSFERDAGEGMGELLDDAVGGQSGALAYACSCLGIRWSDTLAHSVNAGSVQRPGSNIGPPKKRATQRWLVLGPHADRPGASRDAYLRYSVRSWKGADACHAAPDDPSESFSVHWQDSFVCGDRADSEGVLEIESKKNGSVELKFATRRELYAWWKRLQRIQERTMKLGLPADPRAQKFLPRHCRSTDRSTGSLDAVADSVSDAAETAAAHNDPDSWVVVQHCAKRILERLTRPPRVETSDLGPRVFAYRVRDAIGQLGEILTYERDDIMLETQREGRKVSCSCWRHVERWEPGSGTTKMGEHDVVVYCSSTRSSGRSDAISSGALTIACELRCALIAVDFLGSGGSQDAGASFGYWERYDLLAAVRYAKRQFPSAKIVLWGGAPTGAVACALYGSVRLEVALKGMVLDGCTTQLKTHVSDLASLAIKPTSALRRKLVDDVVALVDERFRKRTGVGLKAVAPQTAICGHAFSGTHCLLIGEKDGDVGTARDADILHSELDRAHPDDEHHLLLVGGRTARQRHKKRHVPQALEAVASFIGRRFDVSKGFRYFTVNSPKGIRDHLLHSVPPWDHNDPSDADLRARHEAISREEIISPTSMESFHVPLQSSESNEEYKEYHGEEDPGPGRTRVVKAISFHE